MHDFERKLITEWRVLKAVDSGPVVVGLSGGADSGALTCAMSALRKAGKLENGVIVAHFNHRLRGEDSELDANFTRELAGSLEFEYRLGVAHKNEIQGNTEQSARRARYKFLRETAIEAEAGIVLTAHTINDQAETFLANLLRGSGPDGLSAMAVERDLGNTGDVKLIRPLLRWATRDLTVQYCRDRSIAFRNDSMNDDVSFNRVRIRKELIPMLQEFNPSIIETLARTAGSIRNSQKSLERLLSENSGLREMVNGTFLGVGKLKEMPAELMQLVIRNWVRARIGNLKGVSFAHLNGIAALVKSAKSGRIVELPGGKVVVKGSGRLELRDREFDKSRLGVYN